MKTTSSYNMTKGTKRLLMVTSKEKHSFTKKLFIEAELAYLSAKRAKIKDNSKPDLEA